MMEWLFDLFNIDRFRYEQLLMECAWIAELLLEMQIGSLCLNNTCWGFRVSIDKSELYF